MKKLRKKLIKKLGRKGFTLVELLAVIVVLAIVMVVAIPNVLNSITSARSGMLQTSSNTVADWVEKQYALATFGSIGDTSTVDANFTAYCTSAKKYCVTAVSGKTTANVSGGATKDQTLNFLRAAGVKSGNYTDVYVSVDASGRACVKLTGSASGDFKSSTKVCSNNCTGTC